MYYVQRQPLVTPQRPDHSLLNMSSGGMLLQLPSEIT